LKHITLGWNLDWTLVLPERADATLRESGASMTPDPYRNAFETAMMDLAQITTQFDWLRTRKSHIENLIIVLQETLGANEPAATGTQSSADMVSSQRPQETASDVVEMQADPDNYSFLQVPSPSPLSESSSDPFQRRGRTSFRFRGISAQKSY
jgi:hypothetical protein